MKIPFDIKYKPQIESGKYKVQTRDGHSVRIICWDAQGYRPIMALIQDGDSERCVAIRENGNFDIRFEHIYDLFIITPEAEVTEFEEMLYSILDAYNGLKIDVGAAVVTNAKTLLELAKKEICKGCTVSIDSYIKGRDDERKEAEKSSTSHYPTYEPPCFHGGACINPLKDCINCPRTGGDIGISTTSGTCKKD